jgi:peptidoglycan/LPS O-acetylase OafA/YrhL
LRLAPPFLAALLLTTAAAAVARHWLSDEFVPTAPTLLQFLAHATLLHEAVDAEALSAGVWYVAIDFQLHALLALLLWLGWRSGRLWPGQLLVVLVAMGSLWGWNRLPELDSWPIYFFGSYGLGAAAYWATANGDQPMRRAGWMAGMVTAGLLALLLAFRARIALSLSVAMLLAAGLSVRCPLGLNRLLHGVAMYAALWAVSVALGWVFERWVEAPLGRWVGR